MAWALIQAVVVADTCGGVVGGPDTGHTARWNLPCHISWRLEAPGKNQTVLKTLCLRHAAGRLSDTHGGKAGCAAQWAGDGPANDSRLRFVTLQLK